MKQKRTHLHVLPRQLQAVVEVPEEKQPVHLPHQLLRRERVARPVQGRLEGPAAVPIVVAVANAAAAAAPSAAVGAFGAAAAGVEVEPKEALCVLRSMGWINFPMGI